MNEKIMFERDLLYPTDVTTEPGSVHIKIFNPNKNGKMPVIIEGKTDHSPIKYIEAIIRIMQNDIFDRILLNVKTNAIIYIQANNDISKEYGNTEYVIVKFNDLSNEFIGIDNIDF